MSKQAEYTKILVLRTIGNILIFTSLIFMVKTFYLPVKQELQYGLNILFKKEYVIETESYNKPENEDRRGLLAKVLTGNQQEILTPQDPNFSIVIPKIGANSNVIPDVNAADEAEYSEALQHGVAHARGTAFPGEPGHIFMFAHSTDYFWNVGSYNAVFYLLSKLERDDEVNLIYKGQRFRYRVTSKEVVDPSQVEYITRKTDKEFLTLQTCWPPGTTIKRQLVFAERVID